jgi:hypothetical protein
LSINPAILGVIAGGKRSAGSGLVGSRVLLMHCDGSNGSTTFIDDSPLAQTLTLDGGGLTISTAQSVFGGASLAGTLGTGGIRCPAGSVIANCTVAAYTYECWVRFNDTGTNQYLMATDDAGGSNTETVLRLRRTTGNKIAAYTRGISGANEPTTTTSVTSGVWYHVAVCWDASTHRIYLDGVKEHEVAVTGAGYDASGLTYTIARLGSFAALGLNGYLDEIHFWRGDALYTANFTPPAAPYS